MVVEMMVVAAAPPPVATPRPIKNALNTLDTRVRRPPTCVSHARRSARNYTHALAHGRARAGSKSATNVRACVRPYVLVRVPMALGFIDIDTRVLAGERGRARVSGGRRPVAARDIVARDRVVPAEHRGAHTISPRSRCSPPRATSSPHHHRRSLAVF